MVKRKNIKQGSVIKNRGYGWIIKEYLKNNFYGYKYIVSNKSLITNYSSLSFILFTCLFSLQIYMLFKCLCCLQILRKQFPIIVIFSVISMKDQGTSQSLSKVCQFNIAHYQISIKSVKYANSYYKLKCIIFWSFISINYLK